MPAVDRERVRARGRRPRLGRPAAEQFRALPVGELRAVPAQRERHRAHRRGGALHRVLEPGRQPVLAHGRRRAHAPPAARRACQFGAEDAYLGACCATLQRMIA